MIVDRLKAHGQSKQNTLGEVREACPPVHREAGVVRLPGRQKLFYGIKSYSYRFGGLVAALLVAAGIKVFLLVTQSVPFNSDEAIVGLMARHILQGERPVFFYGQAYMGSLDAWLVSSAFRWLGEGLAAIRVVQVLLYMLYLLTLWLLARRFFEKEAIATLAVWIAAIPPVLMTTYTTATLGGYLETLIFGNLILWLGYEVIFGRWVQSWLAWLALGLISGVAFWTLGLSGIYLLPVALAGLWKFNIRRLPLYVLAGTGFLLGSSPWWIYNFSHAGESLAALTGTSRLKLAPTTPGQRLIGLIALGIPSLLGIRFPWSPEFSPWPVLLASLLTYLALGATLMRGANRKKLGMAPGSVTLLGLLAIVFCIIFIGTHFGIDATGRYLLPLFVPVFLFLAAFAYLAWQTRPYLGIAILVTVLLMNGFETYRAAYSTDKITTQFDPITRFDNSFDDELVAFLHQHGELRGYTNYWVSFRLAFITQESILYVARLPYKPDMRFTLNDDRYALYGHLVEASPKVAYITSKHPTLDRQLRNRLNELSVGFAEVQIGDYHVFYNLDRPVRPDELGSFGS